MSQPQEPGALEALRAEHAKALEKLTQQNEMMKKKLADTVKQNMGFRGELDQMRHKAEVAEQAAASIPELKSRLVALENEIASLKIIHHTQLSEGESKLAGLQAKTAELEAAQESLLAQLV